MTIRVLLAEDSPTMRYYLASLLAETDDFQVVGEARNGEEALALTQQLKPDVISMDIRMPRMDGLEATRRIMSECPTPVVVVSGLLEHEVDLAFQAVQAGALAVVEKPPERSHPAFSDRQHQLLKTLRAMAGVRVVARRERIFAPGAASAEVRATPVSAIPAVAAGSMLDVRTPSGRLRAVAELVAIGASAGGPSALTSVLSGVRTGFRLPIVIVQHMPGEFVPGLARWLEKSAARPVRVASDGLVLEAGMVYLAPGGSHLTIARQRLRGEQAWVAHLVPEQGPHRYQPSVDVLFASIAATCGAGGVGIILTGMGEDGADGLLAMRQAGARTLAQDRESCIVYGMPGAAVERGAVEQVVPLSRIAAILGNLG